MDMEGQILFGKYKIQSEIARGGMGMVYLATDVTLHRQVAIKVLHAQYSGDASFVERFLREARAMARLDHQNIIRIYAVEEEKQSHYIVMEYFPGKDLKQLIREQGPIPRHKILDIGINVSKALAYAHERNLVHRDIKPANIMVHFSPFSPFLGGFDSISFHLQDGALSWIIISCLHKGLLD